MPNGYHGAILEVDLSTGRVEKRALDAALVEDYLGGRGLATRIFCDEIDPTCDPLGVENVLVLATSPLVGSNAPTSCRGHMVFKSPLTGVIGSSNCGGTWAPAFKSAGYDAIVIKGAAKTPVFIDITPERVEILPADHLWGLDVHQTTDALLKERAEDKRSRVLCIGPAGENLVRFAAVMNDKNRAYGRGGPGAVLGAKKLKAIRVTGDWKIETADAEKYRAGADQARYLIKATPTTKRLLRDMGTAGLVKLIDLIDMLPHRNFGDNQHAEGVLEQTCGETLRDRYLVKSGACGMCPLACQRHTQVGERRGEGPEYETLALLGPNCDIYDLEAVTLANYLCNELGMDTISCAVTISCAMELFEIGALPPDDTDGIDLRFGSADLLETLVKKIAAREGVGDWLAEGSRRLAERCGRPELSMSVKGMEMPAYDPRSSYAQALGYMTSPTGACHLRGGYAASLAFFGGAKEIPRFSVLQSPIAIRNLQNLGVIQDSLGICRFTSYAFGTAPWSRMVSGITGCDISTARLEEIADRISALERLFNLEAGATRDDDVLPERFSTTPIMAAGQKRVVSIETSERLRAGYYALRKWDEQGGADAGVIAGVKIAEQSDMSESKWKTNDALIRRFQRAGRALLLCDLEDSHSGNIAMRFTDDAGAERIAITATGSQKGDLEPRDICFLSADQTDYGYYKASSETDIHARILAIEGTRAAVHAHTKNLSIVTLDDEDKPNQPPPFVPIDPLCYYHLGVEIPVDWVSVPSGSKEMVETIPRRLADHRITSIQGHGVFAKGRTIEEGVFRVCLAENSGYIVRIAEKVGVDVAVLRESIKKDAETQFAYVPGEYTIDDDEICEFPEEHELVREFRKTGARIFESHISPFHTGSLSVRGVDSLLYAPKASMPREINGPLLRTPLGDDDGDSRELQIHKAIYAHSHFQTVAHCYGPEAEALSHFVYPGESAPNDRIIPVDAEGSFFYLVIPVVPPKTDVETLIRLLHDYQVVIVRGGGVWSVGSQSLSEVLHHPSSVREICLYRIAAYERGLDLRKMEPAKAKAW